MLRDTLLIVHARAVVVAQDVNDLKKVAPNPNGMPGSSLLVTFGSVLMYLALFGSLIFGVVAVIRWQAAKRTHSAMGGSDASQGILTALGGSVLLAVLGALIAWAYSTGATAVNSGP